MSDPATAGGVWYVVGGAIAAAASGAIGWKASSARRTQETAEAVAAAVVADANGQVYTRLLERLTAAEEDIRQMRHELAAVRRQFRHAEDHISMMQRTMRDAGLDPPDYIVLELAPFERKRA